MGKFPNPDTQFKAGNPGGGRPKGSISLSTIVRDYMMNPPDWEKVPVKGSEEFSKKYPKKAAAFALTEAAFAQAMEGDSSAREWLRKSGWGDKIDITSGDKPIPIMGGISVSTDQGVPEDQPPKQAGEGDSGGDGSRQDDSNPPVSD